jgi:hypothetical protein
MSANPEIMTVPFVPEEFDVDIYQYPHMVLIDNPHSEQLDTQYTFTDEESSYQLRYTFFRQTTKDDSNIKAAYAMCIMPIILNAAGSEESIGQMSNFNDDDVKNEFNGDFGTSVVLRNPTSDFGEGYSLIMLSFFYKKNQGIVVHSLLFNDPAFVQSENFLEIYYSFKFHE